LFHQRDDGAVERVETERGGGDQQGIIESANLGEQLGIAKNGFGAVGTECEGLTKGELGLADHALLFGAGLGVVDPVVVDAADAAPELGKGLLGVVVAHELPVALEPAQVALDVGFVHEITDLLHRRGVGDPVADEALRILAPEFVIPLKSVLVEGIERLRFSFMMIPYGVR
jgi:hypothetical protein